MTTPTHEDEPRLSITRVWARNFKSIRKLDLELGPLTVLVGPNASGKSNVLDVLRFISHALRRDLDEAVTSRGGVAALRRSTHKGGAHDVEVGFIAKRGGFQIKYGFVLGSRSGLYRVKREYGVVTPANPEEEPVEFMFKGGQLVKPSLESLGMHTEPGEDIELQMPVWKRILFGSPSRDWKKSRMPSNVDWAVSFISRMQFYRLFPDTLRELQRPQDTNRLNREGSNLASVLRGMVRRKSPYLDEIESALGQVVPGLSSLRVQQSGGFLVIKLRHGGANGGSAGTTFDLSQESDGTVRLLGLLTALYQESPPLLIGIEEPELTIHPGALAVLADVMVEATHRTQVLVTTHSPDLIDRLPIESLRAVQIQDGCTKVGPVSETQAETVREGLFTSGELHSMEGLEPRT